MAGLMAIKSKARAELYIDPQQIVSVEAVGNGSTKIIVTVGEAIYADDPVAQVVSDINAQMNLG
jgi:hypothetical protein